MPAWEPTQKKI